MSKIEITADFIALRTAKKPHSHWMPPRGYVCQEIFRSAQSKDGIATAEAFLSFAKLSILSFQEK